MTLFSLSPESCTTTHFYQTLGCWVLGGHEQCDWSLASYLTGNQCIPSFGIPARCRNEGSFTP